MKYLKIKNKGIITVEAITLLGASSKRGSNNKIGYFGSGNKFAIAYLLRNNFELNVYAGLEEFKIETIEKKLGQDIFKVLVINNQQTSITTEFGAKWELWQALREIYSNAIDEGDASIELVNTIEPLENETHFYIKAKPEITEWIGNFDNYFSENKDVLFENKYGRILAKHNEVGNFYRKGIKVWNTNKNSLYDYDVNDITITEDRLVMYDWTISEKIWNLLYSCNNVEIIRNVLQNSSKPNLIEGSISEYASLSSSEISEEFKTELSNGKFCSVNMGGYLKKEEKLNTTILPSKVFDLIRHHLKDENLGERFRVGRNGILYREIELTPLYKATLDKAKEFFAESLFTEPLDYNIICGIFDNKNIGGYADDENKCIVISNLGFESGVNYLVEAIIEEYIHLKYKVYDETRGFQDAIIKELITVLKQKNSFLI